MTEARVSVIILNWNGAEMLKRFLPQVIATTPASLATVIVADNASTDNSVELLMREFPTVGIIRLDKNYGYAEGYNRTVSMVDSQYTVLLNSDVATTDGWIETLVSYMDTHPQTAACQPKLRAVNQPEMFEYAGASGGFLDRNGYPYCRGRIFGTIESDTGQYDLPLNVDWASGAALMVRRDLYVKAGGLDARFFAHMEEIDLCWRLRLMGYDIAAVPAATVHHLGGGALPAGNPRKTYLNFRNNLLLLYKNVPHKTRVPKLVKRRLLDTLAWAKFMLALDFGNANAVLKAHRDFRRMKKAYSNLPSPATNLLKGRPNILTAYYLRRKKRFAQIMQSR